jgi:hypothetical protein
VSDPAEQEPPDEATVAAYLSNRLDPASAEAFEAYCLHHPAFARRVEADLLFKVGLKQIQGSDLVRRTRHRRRIGLAIAAGVTLLLAGGLLLIPQLRPGSLVAYRSATEVPASLLSGPRVTLTLIRLRDGSAVHRVTAPLQAAVLGIRVLPDSPPGRLGYTVGIALEHEVLRQSVTLDALQPDANGYIEVYLPLAGLVGQTLRITVNPSPATGTESPSFRVQVANPEGAPADAP